MRTNRLVKVLFWLVLVLLLLVAGVYTQGALARASARPAAQTSPLHPVFPLLDLNGENVLESGLPVSTIQTCGQCHDTGFIAAHSFHADLGLSETVPAGNTPSGRPWDTSSGPYGGWNPLLYRYLSPAGDSRIDLDTPGWVRFFAGRLTGGGPAEAEGIEMNCFLCHLEQPDNAARVEAIESGQGDWASTATLLGTGIVEKDGAGYRWNPAAFNSAGELDEAYVRIQDPLNSNCAQCHGLVHTDRDQPLVLVDCSLENWQTATTGQVISDQKISLSGMNLQEKAALSRSWDIHAERGVKCTDCHYSLNNPIHAQANAQNAPGHLQYDPRRLEIGEYLERPDHNFARGQSAQLSLAPESRGTMRRCESCHDTAMHADWLPYSKHHLDEIACETCHIPQLYAPAVQSYDWTVLDAAGSPVDTCRGVEGDSGTLADLVTGFQPVLLKRANIDGSTALAPYNLVTAWYWVYDDPAGPRPVRLEDLRAAWFEGNEVAGEILQAFDADQDGTLSSAELRLDTSEKEALVAGRLESLGLANPRVEGEVQPYSINHGVGNGTWVTRECQACHSEESRLAAPVVLAGYLPGGVMPEFTSGTNVEGSPGLSVDDGALVYRPQTEEMGYYILGHNRVSWIDGLGAIFFGGVLLGVIGHGTLRLKKSLRQSRPGHAQKRVYMYAVYERFWHWLQTFTIVILLFTGLIIHRPDLFGWLSFRYMVAVHNILAIILVINALLSLFYHLVSGEIQQYIPRPRGFFDQAIVQAKFYLQGIFKGDPHPFEKTQDKKLNPLQQVTYFGILNVLLPLQVITGMLMFGVQLWPAVAQQLGGLPFLAPLHSLVAWTFAGFIVAHVYLTTTGHSPLAGIQAMVSGWEVVETQEAAEELLLPQPALAEETQKPTAVAAD
jgi:thiosulfate reductase cytochrome b subunit